MSFDKPDSPFYPDKPLPPDEFFGRADLSKELWKKSVEPVLNHSRTETVWLSGERGIGKTSLALYLMDQAEKKGLFSLKIDLSQAHTVEQFLEKIILTVLDYSRKNSDQVSEFIRESFKKYFESVELTLPIFGGVKAKFNKDAIANDLPEYKRNFVEFLTNFVVEIKSRGFKGVFLLFDEINGLASQAEFANFLKGLSDNLGTHESLLIMICGTEDKRQEIIKNHESINRAFKTLKEVEPLSVDELEQYFSQKFTDAGVSFENTSFLKYMAKQSYGQPKLAQIIGESVFYVNDDHEINEDDLLNGLDNAFDEIGSKFVKPLYSEIKSTNYKRILKVITQMSLDLTNLTFTRQEVIKRLSDSQKNKFDNFIRRMTELKVIKSVRDGEYMFCDFFTKAYLDLYSSIDTKGLND